MATLQEAFGVRSINQVVELFKNNAMNVKLQTYFRDDPSVQGELYEWDEIQFSRKLAPFVGPDGASKNMAEQAKTHRSTSIAHIKINKRINGRKVFQMERAVGGLTPNAEATVGRELIEMRNTIEKTVEWLSAAALAGAITVTSAVITGSVAFSVTYSVQTFAAVAWKTSTTLVTSDATVGVPKIKDTYQRVTQFPLAAFLFNVTVTQSLLGNQDVKTWVQHTLPGVSIFEVGMISRMAGLTWEEYDGTYVDGANAVQKFIPDDKMIGFPQPINYSQYLVMALGKGMIPRTAIGAASSNIVGEAPNAGFYSYATTEDDPVVMKLIMGWVGLAINTYPSSILYVTLT